MYRIVVDSEYIVVGIGLIILRKSTIKDISKKVYNLTVQNMIKILLFAPALSSIRLILDFINKATVLSSDTLVWKQLQCLNQNLRRAGALVKLESHS